jgi:hypothetical protein
MDRPFDAAEFLSELESEELNGRMNQELAKLSREELEQVAALLARKLERKKP